MKFMGKWIIWSHAADGYVIPTEVPPGYPPTMLFANSSMNIDDAVYNIYGGPAEGELLLQANSLARRADSRSPDCWVQCNANDQDSSVVPTANYASATPVTASQNGAWTILQYGSTQLYVNPVFSIYLYQMMLGNPDNDGDPHLNVTVKTQPLDAYKQSRSAVGVDFSNIDFTGVDLSGIDFTNANFDGALMDTRTVLPPGTALAGATFIGAWLGGVSFEGCDLTGADFTKAGLLGAQFDEKTKLAGAKFVGVDLFGLSFAGCDLTGADFTGATLAGLDLQSATLSGAVMAGLDLTVLAASSYRKPPALAGTSTRLTQMSGSTIPAAFLNNRWQWIDLRNATIPDLPQSITKLQAAGAKLSGLNKNVLTGISLQIATLDNALLDGLSLSGADLKGASLIDASLHGATLTNTKLPGANLSGSQLGSLGHLFTLPSSAEAALNGAQVSVLAPFFKQNGITLSSNVTIETLAANRVWQLNDAGNHVAYTIRLETQSGNTQVLTVYAPVAAASLVNAYLPNATLTGANLYGVLANGVQFYGSNARIDGSAVLEAAQLNNSNFSNLNLTQAQLFGANLSGSYLFNAKFNKANLTPSADGVAADLSDANLQGADFTDAQLYGANLSNAAVAVNVPTTAVPDQGGVYLFSLPNAGDTNTLQQYTADLNAAAAALFSLNPDGDQAKLQQYVSALKANNLAPLKLAFLKHQPPIVLSNNAQIQTVEVGSVWQIVDGAQSYTLWTDTDENGNTELYAAPSLTRTQTAFHQNNMTLRWQASVAVDMAGQQWLLDNDSENPQNFSTGYVKFVVKLNGSVLDVYGTAVRIERLGDKNQLQMDTETCNLTVVAVTNMNSQTICPNGTKLSTNQNTGGVQWDTNWLRAISPPKPPTCVPTDYSWCPQTQTTNEPPERRKAEERK
jgi:uncharacterized protein YjbI with pentapeptide repeats